MKNIYYITRSYYPEITGGTIIRQKQVELLKKNGYNVIIVTLTNKKENEKIDKNEIRIYISINILKVFLKFERLGIVEDYLKKFGEKAEKILNQKVKAEDIIFTTSGGELECIKIGSILKKEKKCKFIINLHDPIDHTLVNGISLSKFYKLRDKIEKKYFSNADLIVTSTEYYCEILKKKYGYLEEKIMCNYFGYVKKLKIESKINNKIANRKIRIGYGGTFSKIQSPEILAEACKNMENVEIYFVGDVLEYKEILKYKNYKNIFLLKKMELDKYLEFFDKNIDIGFLSLKGKYFSACIPSKLYEYINLEKPVLALLPKGDAYNIIEKNEIGEVSDEFSKEKLEELISKLIQKLIKKDIYIKLKNVKNKYEMEKNFLKVIEKL